MMVIVFSLFSTQITQFLNLLLFFLFATDDDPKGSFTFDVDFDSTEQNIMLTLEHACVEGKTNLQNHVIH